VSLPFVGVNWAVIVPPLVGATSVHEATYAVLLEFSALLTDEHPGKGVLLSLKATAPAE
jgi:hypothetical protein